MMKIFGHPMSTCTRKVLLTLAETGTAHEFVVVDFAKGEHKAKPHTERQPFGKVPALDDDGFALYESRAMCRYINEKVNGKLVPTDLRARARMEQWISIESENFTRPVMKFVYQHIFQRPQTEETIKTATADLEQALGIMETQLTGNAFFAGDQFTIADIVYMPYVGYAMITPAKEIFAKFPHVVAWWNKVSERPSWGKVNGKPA